MPIFISELTSTPSKYWHGFLNTSRLSAKSYFIVLSNFLHTVECIQFFWVFWKYRSQILNAVNGLPSVNSICSHGANGKAELLLWRCEIFHKIYYFTSFTTVVALFLFVYSVGVEPRSPILLFDKMIEDGKRRIMLPWENSKHFNNSSMSISINTDSFVSFDFVFGILETWLRLCLHITYTSIEFLYTGPLPLTMWLVTELFVRITEEMPRIKWTEFTSSLIKKYELLKSSSNSLNSIWSLGLFIWMFEVNLRILFLMNKMIASKDPLNLINAAISVVIPVLVMVLSGEVYRKVCKNIFLYI